MGLVSLVRLHMSNPVAAGGLTTSLKTSIRLFLKQSEERPDTPSPNNGKTRVCKVCQKDAHESGYKANKNLKGKVISKCSKCQNHICGRASDMTFFSGDMESLELHFSRVIMILCQMFFHIY